jgi:FtsP/CotA-like multicopper oxidase with cupredoxin domain
MISETEKMGIINNDGFLFSKNPINKILSISLAFFIISNILTASTVAFAMSSSSSSTTATSNTISDATVNNSNNIEKQKSQPPLQQPKTHEYTLIAKETTLQIAPSVRVDAWTYNDTIPGPTLTATEGDRVIIHFINKTPLPHTVHLHGDHPSEQDGVFEQISANGTYTYDFIATPAGALMYHCHVSPVMQHVRMGLYGAFIIYPKEPLPPAREYVLVDGEYDTQNQLNPFPEYNC